MKFSLLTLIQSTLLRSTAAPPEPPDQPTQGGNLEWGAMTLLVWGDNTLLEWAE